MTPRCEIDLEDRNTFPHDNLAQITASPYQIWYKKQEFCDSEDINRTNIHDILNLHCDLDLERGDPIFPSDTPADTAEIVIF